MILYITLGLGWTVVNEVVNIRLQVGLDSVVGIVACYGLDNPGSNSGGGEIFHTRPDRPWGHSVSCNLGTGSISWGQSSLAEWR